MVSALRINYKPKPPTMNTKNLLQLGVIILILSACSPTSKNCPEEPPLVPQFLAQIHLKDDATAEGARKDNGAEELIQIIGLAVDDAFSGSLITYDATLEGYKNLVVLSPDEFEEKMIRVDTAYMENPEPPYDLKMVNIRDTFKGRHLASIRLFESWRLSESFILEKTVSHYMPVRQNVDPLTGMLRSWNPLFIVNSVEPSGEPISVAHIQYTQPVVKKDGDYPYQWYRENLETSIREKFFDRLLSSMKSGALTCYENPEALNPVSHELIESALLISDTMLNVNPDLSMDLQMEVMEMELDWHDVNAIEFVQEVKYFENGAITIDVKSYRPIMGIPDLLTGDVTDLRGLFWIKNS